MRKRLLTILFVLLFALSSCDDTNIDDTTKKTDDNNTQEVDENEQNNEEQLNDGYVKDGDVVRYFTLFGTERDCTEDWGFGESATCYEINIVSDGLDITMRYYSIEDSYYETFDFIAKNGDAILVTQMDYQVRIDTTVTFRDTGKYIDGFLQYNGLNQTPMFELNKNYSYEDWGNGSEDAMKSMLNTMIVAVDRYYQENIDANIVTTE